MRIVRAICAMVAAVAALATTMASPAMAGSRDIDVFDLPFFPCQAAAPDVGVPPSPGAPSNDGAYAHICFINWGGGGPWQASTGEWILFRVREEFTTSADCSAFVASTTVSVRFQGDPAAFTTLPCQFFIPRNSWVTAFYFQTHPLPPDVYTATIALTPSGGPTTVLSQSVTVIQHG